MKEKTFIQVAQEAAAELSKRCNKKKGLEYLLVAVDYKTNGGSLHILKSEPKEKGLIPNFVVNLMREDRAIHDKLVEILLICLSDNDLLSLIKKCTYMLDCRVGINAKLRTSEDGYIK